MPTDDEDNKPPPEALILFACMAVIFGGTLIINFIINLFIPGLNQ